MRLENGSHLGPYEIVAPIGAGGMGEVYRARDPRLEREVAIKVLPEHLAESPELRQRFEREAKAVSSLSHPHICALYDVGVHEKTDYLVMELLEGETLATRLQSGPLSPDELLRTAIQIADALDKAHRQGVIHRDLKPGNVMLTKSGAKLLDFGLAKATGPGGGPGDLTQTPTQSQPLTAAGTILGTYQYMSPEQLEGREADARSDLFAFGCLLHEMATGQRAFRGASQASLIGSIMHEQPPPASSLQAMVPPALDRVIQACLAKDPDQRWQTAHDVLLQLQWIAEGGSMVGLPAPVAARRRSRERLAWALVAATAITAAVLAVGFVRRAPEAPRTVRFQVFPPPDLAAVGSPRISPDGRHLAFSAAETAGGTRIWIHSLDALEPRPLNGTEGAGRPFWSPDSRFLAFFADGKLKKVEISGSPAQVICDAPSGADGSWGRKGVILFDGQSGDPIRSVLSSGGAPKSAIESASGEAAREVGWPEFLPDGERFLYVEDVSAVAGEGTSRLMVGSLDAGFEPWQVLDVGSRVQYAEPGYLIYVRDGNLLGQAFDADRLEILGEPVPLAEEMGTDQVGLAHFSASANGVLAYREGESGSRSLVWRSREGAETGEAGEPARYSNPALSPDGNRLAVEVADSQSGEVDLWVRDLRRGVSSRFTFETGADLAPLFSPDGAWLYFFSSRGETQGLYRKPASGVGQAELVLGLEDRVSAHSFSPDGRFLAFNRRTSGDSGWDIWILPLEGGKAGEPFPFVAGPFVEVRPAFSPDGRWIAYDSTESGRSEVYVQQFPGPGGKWQVSVAGGTEPTWGPNGSELLYLTPELELVRVGVGGEEAPAFEVPEVLFPSRVHPETSRNRYVVSADGERFLILTPQGRESVFPTTVVLGWDAALGR